MERQVHDKMKAYIKKHELIAAGDELVLGVSGGADSMMMLSYFYSHQKEYNVTIKVAHIHHGIRESAELDAQLVEGFCKKREIPFYRHDCNIKELSKKRKMSEEEVGREERYNFFISLLNGNGKIVTAHNMNDQAETMIMRFVRGTDVKGLAGIMPRRDCIIRPLLCLSRAEIEAYCKALAIPYRDDETNFKTIYTRNKIRLECIPYIKKNLNPSIISSLGRQSELYREEDEFLKEHTKELFDRCTQMNSGRVYVELEAFMKEHTYMQKRIMLLGVEKLIGRKDITMKHIASLVELASLQVGREIHLPCGLVARREYHQVVLVKDAKNLERNKNREIKDINGQGKEGRENLDESVKYCVNITEGKIEIDEVGIELEVRKIPVKRINQNNENIYTKYIDYGKIKNGLQIRTRQASDHIKLKSGSKKLKKLFTDDKISRTKRDTIPLIADGDEIVWVVGNRLNFDYYITEHTKEVLEIKILRGY